MNMSGLAQDRPVEDLQRTGASGRSASAAGKRAPAARQQRVNLASMHPGSQEAGERERVDRRQRVEVGERHTHVRPVHRLADEPEFEHRTERMDVASVGGTAAGVEGGRPSDDVGCRPDDVVEPGAARAQERLCGAATVELVRLAQLGRGEPAQAGRERNASRFLAPARLACAPMPAPDQFDLQRQASGRRRGSRPDDDAPFAALRETAWTCSAALSAAAGWATIEAGRCQDVPRRWCVPAVLGACSPHTS